MSHISLSGQWLSVNQKICDIVGYSKDELFKLTFQDITHPDDLEVDLALVEKMLRGEIQTYSLEKRYIKKNGSHVWINLTVSLVRDSSGSPLYFISVIEDIQQRKNVENQLRAMHEEMEFLVEKRTAALKIEMAERKRAEKERNGFFELSNDLMAIFGYDGFLKAANPALRKLLGYTEGELYSRKFIEFIHPDDLEKTLEISEDFRRTGIFPGMENRYICENGNIILLSWALTAVPEDGCMYAIARDITETRKQEMELIEQKLKSEANSKMNAMGRMASGIAHEINNPLTIVYGQTKMLKKMIEENQLDREKLLPITNSMDKMCDRIVRIINGLRTFSRDATNDPFDFCSVQKILQETLSFCQGRVRGLGIELTVDEVSDEYELFGRSVQISQVLLNLIDNAIDAVKTVEKKRIHIKFISDSKRIGFAVIDSGPGIKSDHISNLFTPFFTTKEVGVGTGLGLSIAKGIIEAHGGCLYLEAASKETCFTFYLPQVSSNLI